MERRLNCYNFIFSKCVLGSRCPYGHVIVSNKEEYLHKYNHDIDKTRKNTSPRDNLEIRPIGARDFLDSHNAGSSLDSEMKFVHCSQCNSLKLEMRPNPNWNYLCRECELCSLNRDFGSLGFAYSKNIFGV